MNQQEFESQITRLRNHYSDRQYTTEMVALLLAAYSKMHVTDFSRIITEAIATRPVSRPPLRDDFAEIADSLGLEAVRKNSWKYVTVDDCLRCGGCGYFWIECIDGRIATRCCNDCFAGRNLQQAPRPTITLVKIPPGWHYVGPGEAKKHSEAHWYLKERFGSLGAMQKALNEKRVSTTSLRSDLLRYAMIKSANRNADNPNHDKKLEF